MLFKCRGHPSKRDLLFPGHYLFREKLFSVKWKSGSGKARKGILLDSVIIQNRRRCVLSGKETEVCISGGSRNPQWCENDYVYNVLHFSFLDYKYRLLPLGLESYLRKETHACMNRSPSV